VCSRVHAGSAGHGSPSQPADPKDQSIAPVSDDEKQAIAALLITVRVKADADIVRDQDRPSQCCAILEGFACRYKLLPGGRRQIVSFHIPGDTPDLQSLHL
jgi:CRP-like cAMP-binding protein